jgi:hypothetical protein
VVVVTAAELADVWAADQAESQLMLLRETTTVEDDDDDNEVGRSFDAQPRDETGLLKKPSPSLPPQQAREEASTATSFSSPPSYLDEPN